MQKENSTKTFEQKNIERLENENDLLSRQVQKWQKILKRNL